MKPGLLSICLSVLLLVQSYLYFIQLRSRPTCKVEISKSSRSSFEFEKTTSIISTTSTALINVERLDITTSSSQSTLPLIHDEVKSSKSILLIVQNYYETALSNDQFKNAELILPLLYPFIMPNALLPAVNIFQDRPHFIADCSSPAWSNILTGRKRKVPVKIYDMIPFLYEFDILEIRMMELIGLVDRHVVLEGNLTHRLMRKPEFLRSSLEYRFKPFNIFYCQQMINLTTTNQLNDWRMNSLAWYELFNCFMAYIEQHDDNLFIIGDADEIPSFETITILKKCELQKNVNIMHTCSTFFLSSVKYTFEKTGLGCNHQNHGKDSIVYPTIATWKYMKSNWMSKERADWRNPKKANFLPAQTGYHFSSFGEDYEFLFKIYAAAEATEDVDKIVSSSFNPRKDIYLHRNLLNHIRINNVSALKLPWFLRQNKMRYLNFFTSWFS